MRTRISAIALTAAVLVAATAFADPPRSARGQAPRSTAAAPDETAAATSSGWIGVWLVDEIDGGARIVALVPGGPAERASLRVGDIIVRANARPVPQQDTLTTVLETLAPGSPLALQVIRGGTSLERSLEVAARPGRPLVSMSYSRPPRRGLDLEVSEITPALREHYGAPGDAGVLVLRSDPDGLGARSGIRVGDVLVSVGDQPIRSPRQVQWLVWEPAGDREVDVRIVRDGKPESIRLVTLESAGDPAQDGKARRLAENEAVAKRLQLELARLERRMAEIRRELKRLEENRPD